MESHAYLSLLTFYSHSPPSFLLLVTHSPHAPFMSLALSDFFFTTTELSLKTQFSFLNSPFSDSLPPHFRHINKIKDQDAHTTENIWGLSLRVGTHLLTIIISSCSINFPTAGLDFSQPTLLVVLKRFNLPSDPSTKGGGERMLVRKGGVWTYLEVVPWK